MKGSVYPFFTLLFYALTLEHSLSVRLHLSTFDCQDELIHFTLTSRSLVLSYDRRHARKQWDGRQSFIRTMVAHKWMQMWGPDRIAGELACPGYLRAMDMMFGCFSFPVGQLGAFALS